MKIALETELMQVLVVDKFAMYKIKAGVVDQNMPLDISLTKFFCTKFIAIHEIRKPL